MNETNLKVKSNPNETDSFVSNQFVDVVSRFQEPSDAIHFTDTFFGHINI